MTLVVYWYDMVCFAIIGGAIIGSVYVLISRFRKGSSEEVTSRCHVSSSNMWTCRWLGLHPTWLLAVRFGSFCVLAVLLTWDIIKWGGSIFVYYTEWTFSLVMLYFAIGTLLSARGCWLSYTDRACIGSYVKITPDRNDLEQSQALLTKKDRFSKGCARFQTTRFWGCLMEALYQTCGGAVVLTDIVFWCIIVPFMPNAHPGLNTLTGCMHTLNLATLLIETCLNRLEFGWLGVAYFVLWSSSYVIFQWLIHLCGFTWWPYPFLELSTPWAPLWYLALAASHIACYGTYALIVTFKDLLFSKLFAYNSFTY